MSEFRFTRFKPELILAAALVLAWIFAGALDILDTGVLGVEIGPADDGYEIVRVVSSTAAEEAGFQVGDRLKSLDGITGQLSIGEQFSITVGRDGQPVQIEGEITGLTPFAKAIMLAIAAMLVFWVLSGLGFFLKIGSLASMLYLLGAINESFMLSRNPEVYSTLLTQVDFWMTWVLGTLAPGLLLHFLLVFPRPLAIAEHSCGGGGKSRCRGCRTVFWIYLPGVVVSALIVAKMIAAFTSPPLENVLFIILVLLAGHLLPNVYAIACLAVLVYRWVTTSPEERRAFGLNVLTWGVVLPMIPYLVLSFFHYSVIPGGPSQQPFTLFFLPVILAFTYSLHKSRQHPADRPAEVTTPAGSSDLTRESTGR
ncbi:MAG TPA: hypothetical protein VGG06_33705 [Thermoanaerobaculia bacterium]|jgi:hypothetical protein